MLDAEFKKKRKETLFDKGLKEHSVRENFLAIRLFPNPPRDVWIMILF